MTRILIFVFIILLSLTSFGYSQDYKMNREKTNYLIDTIRIDNPVRLEIRDKNLYLMIYIDESLIPYIKNKKFEDILNNENVFFFSNNPYNYLSVNDFPGYQDIEFEKWKKISRRMKMSKPILDDFLFLRIKVNIDCYNFKEGYSEFRKLYREELNMDFVNVIYPIEF